MIGELEAMRRRFVARLRRRETTASQVFTLGTFRVMTDLTPEALVEWWVEQSREAPDPVVVIGWWAAQARRR